MTLKERAAMQQALEALELFGTDDMAYIKSDKAITALREALDHSGEASEMVGCAYCNNPLFAGTKCNNCGFITLAEQAEPNSTFMEGYRIGLAEMREKCATVSEQGTGEAVQKTALELLLNERKRIAAAIRAIKFEGDTGFRPVSEMIAEHKQDPKKAAAIEKAKMRKAEQKPVGVVEGSGEWGIAGVLVAGVPIGTKLYAAPVRQVDLTDDEIEQVRKSFGDEVISAVAFARAVIAADREKNK